MTLPRPLRRSHTAPAGRTVPDGRAAPEGRAVPLMATVPPDGGRLRRCTYRKIEVASPVPARGRELPVYNVSCLYPDMQQSLPLGTLDSARAICNACVATGVFRADED